MDVVLTISQRDFSTRLANYDVQERVEIVRVVKTIDGVEHATTRSRDVILFRLQPFSDSDAASDRAALISKPLTVTYSNPHTNITKTQEFRLVSDINAAFGIKSINGNRYYKGGTIELRAVRCN